LNNRKKSLRNSMSNPNSTNYKPGKLFTYPPGKATSLNIMEDDLIRLITPQEYLNDTLIDFYLKYDRIFRFFF